MSNSPQLIVVIPVPGKGLYLGHSLLRAHPPMFARFEGCDQWFRDGFSCQYQDEDEVVELAMPVWWSNGIVEEGWDKLRRLLASEDLPANPTVDVVLKACSLAVQRGIIARFDQQQ